MDVFIQHTALADYSTDLQAETLPEGTALKQLRQHALAEAGIDLFADTIKPGNRVVIKPNLVRDWHPDQLDLYALIVHPAVIRAVVDEVYDALHGDGEIIIADAPIGDADWGHLLAVTELEQIAEYYWARHKFKVEIRDLRKYRYTMQHGPHSYAHEVRHDLAGDPAGYVEVDLGEQSAFASLPNLHLLQGTDVVRRAETIANHTPITNKYLIARTILDADVLISLPKLKTHGKVGVTLNSKNMIGINGDKNYLPHYRWGSSADGGDQHPAGEVRNVDEQRMRFGRLVADQLLSRDTRWAKFAVHALQQASGFAAKLAKLPPIEPLNGHWSGNDTCWRLAADLIRVSVFADRNGILHNTPQRRFLSIIDGIVGGEGNGPLRATPKPCGVLIAGTHPIATDLVATHLMGFDYRKIRYLRELADGDAAYMQPGFGTVLPEQITVHTNVTAWEALFQKTEGLLNFISPPRWEGTIELYSEKRMVTPLLAQEA